MLETGSTEATHNTLPSTGEATDHNILMRYVRSLHDYFAHVESSQTSHTAKFPIRSCSLSHLPFFLFGSCIVLVMIVWMVSDNHDLVSIIYVIRFRRGPARARIIRVVGSMQVESNSNSNSTGGMGRVDRRHPCRARWGKQRRRICQCRRQEKFLVASTST
jgi:hypothetical protein